MLELYKNILWCFVFLSFHLRRKRQKVAPTWKKTDVCKWNKTRPHRLAKTKRILPDQTSFTKFVENLNEKTFRATSAMARLKIYSAVKYLPFTSIPIDYVSVANSRSKAGYCINKSRWLCDKEEKNIWSHWITQIIYANI